MFREAKFVICSTLKHQYRKDRLIPTSDRLSSNITRDGDANAHLTLLSSPKKAILFYFIGRSFTKARQSQKLVALTKERSD